MSNENEHGYGTEYEATTQGVDEGTQPIGDQAASAAPVKKSSAPLVKVIGFAIALLIVAVVCIIGYMMVFGHRAPAPAPHKPAVVKPAPAKPALPLVVPAASKSTEAAKPVLLAPASTTALALPGALPAPAASAPVMAPVVPTAPGSAALVPVGVATVPPPALPTPVLPAPVLSPAPSLPASASSVKAPVVAPVVAAPTPVVEPAAPMASSNGLQPADQRLVDALREALLPVNEHLTALDSRVSRLETRIDEMHGSRAAAPVKAEAVKSEAVKAEGQPAVKRSAPRQRFEVESQKNEFEVLSRDGDASVAPVPAKVAPAPVKAADQPTSKATPAASDCQLQAIVEGRMWIKQADGSSQTYGVGDVLNGATITAIDPKGGVQTSRGSVSCGR